MNVSLYQAAAAMNANMRWQELIVENLSAGSIPGFRKRDMSFSAVQAGLDPTAAPGSPRYMYPSTSVSINTQPGELRATGSVLDFAVEGPGFFEVQLPNGSRAYTRDGEFHLNAQGQVVTKQGYSVLGDNGPVSLDPSNPAPITVASTGEVSQGDQPRGRIRVVDFNQPHALTPVGNGYYLADQPGVKPGNVTVSSIRQGYLEGSNSSPTVEMASLLTAMRLFEANQKVLQTQDERMGRVISELGGTS